MRLSTNILKKSEVLQGLIEDYEFYQSEEDEIPLNEIGGKNLDLIIS